MILGIDPGKEGALCFMDGKDINIMSMPLIADEADPSILIEVLMEKKPSICYLEKAQVMPARREGKMVMTGTKGMFTYGVSYGIIRGVVATLKIPLVLVSPSIWTKDLHLGCDGKTAKERSLQAVKRLFPHINLLPPRCRKPHDGWVDALLIAEYGRRKNNGVAFL